LEREVLLTGIGGQGVQLAARVLAVAATAEGRSVQLFGSYSGMMRGGNTDATLVIADGDIEAPPTVGSAWSAIVMHDEYAAGTLAKVRDGGVVVVNADVCDARPAGDGITLLAVGANALAESAGNPVTASMVLVGAFATATGVVALASLSDAVTASLPSYRAKAAAMNIEALSLGSGSVQPLSVPAWAPEDVLS
jgi:Pyruvate/2-oxoacid:ferredoxin oxidoreductase gamma subunit